ncbi:hypothetical protein N431DRAFT_433910 [Stipitochalara longipes BDJ]|nr:hypothetical protein N431DRAFT_433910 [Stipitochalara longipes BDJ]
MASKQSATDFLPDEDRPRVGGPTMKDNLGLGFHRAVYDLVKWFLRTEGHFNPQTLTTAVEEILSEYGNMSDLALQTLIRERYARKIYAVLQTPAVSLNPKDPRNARKITRYEFASLTRPSDIRLFRFSRFITLGNETPYLSCEMVHADLDERPDYTAISYVWGPLDDNVPVIIGENKFIMVTRNLMEVLFRFSGCNSPTDIGNTTRLLWTDQLCINQYDAEERSKQVAMMRRIYSEASTTELWLGEEDENATQAFELIRCFECIPKTREFNPIIFTLTGLNAEEIRESFFAAFPQAVGRIPPASDPRWKALFHFLDRPWFSRLWVFQEAILSSTNRIGNVGCGQMKASVFHLYLARSLLFIDWEVETLPSGFEMVRYLMFYYAYRNLGALPPISFTVWQVGGRLHSGDPRDRVYGLLGVQNPDKELKIEIDYMKSVQDVYIDFTRRCIEEDQNLRVLQYIKESHTIGISNLPSWVPDWNVEAATVPFEGSSLREGWPSRFNASVSLSHTALLPEGEVQDKLRLPVKGKIIDHVVTDMLHDFKIATPLQIEQYFSVNFRVRVWVDSIRRGIESGDLSKDATPEQLQAATIRTITADGFNDSLVDMGDTHGRRLSDEEAIQIYHELERLRDFSLRGESLPEGWFQSKKDMYQRLWINTEVCRGRRVAVLRKHWIMLGPRVEPGDCIAVLHGSTVPWVLRQEDDGCYTVVGQCFVDGVMHGEAVTWKEDDADVFVLV